MTSLDPIGLREAIARDAGQRIRIDQVGGSTLRVSDLAAERIGVLALQAGIAVTQLLTETSNLEQLFFSRTETGRDEPAAMKEVAK